jgi:hypothetical protein
MAVFPVSLRLQTRLNTIVPLLFPMMPRYICRNKDISNEVEVEIAKTWVEVEKLEAENLVEGS